ncbi:MAG: HAMP domain-containing protein [Chroococcidiopsidaceae cyanobacterium CP_BM_ER_R8_30]|nr:HAMP domain-containing protein [Chroococcidiopsidaceae cyanobacterium CP_BM_ER_R8_30]
MRSLRQLGWGTLRLRLTLWYVLIVGLSLLIFSGYLYLQLERSLIAQTDVELRLAYAQAVADLEDEDGNNPGSFPNTEDYQNIARHLSQASFGVRIITSQGKVVDGFGKYRELPTWVPQVSGYATVTAGRTDWRLYSNQIKTGNRLSVYWLQVGQSLSSVKEILASLYEQILLGLPLVLLLTGLGGLFLASRALRPINRITQTAQAISANDLTRRIGYQGSADEVGRLAITFDRMLNRLQAAFNRERRFTADASHELRTPLTAIKGRISVTLSRARTALEYENTLLALEHEVDRLIRLSTDLLFLARLEQGFLRFSRSTLVLSDLLDTILEQAQPLAEMRHITLIEDIASGLSIYGDLDCLIRLFLNLLDNAIKYTPVGGEITVQATAQGSNICVAISDTGPGISPEHLPHLFERFYRVEADRSRSTGGAGLGLAIAWEIAYAHGGTLSVQSQLGAGTTFTVRLPVDG